jgi:mono/diheme cytochrome c family protein
MSRVWRFLKWTLAIVGVLAVCAFLAFLYFIPPFYTMKPEEFIQPEAAAAPTVEHIADPKARAFAEHGREIVMRSGCIGCHQTPGPQGPRWDMYLAGGLKFIIRKDGQVVSRNLTPDPETGLGKRTDDEILRVLGAGVFHDGRLINHRAMPWAELSHLTEEDRRAVVAYLRQVKPIRHAIPDPDPSVRPLDPKAEEVSYSAQDYGR